MERGRRPAFVLFASALAAASSLGWAAGAAGSVEPGSAVTGARGAHHGTAVVKVAKVAKVGTVLVTTKGYTLYLYTPDSATKVACTGTCASIWPPLLLPRGTSKPAGIAELGTVRDPDGKLQVTYKGHPLYTYVGDKKPGTASGQGYGGTWYAVKTSVAPLTRAARSAGSGASGSGASGSGGSGSGW